MNHTHELDIYCTARELAAAIIDAQGRARTNRLEPHEAQALAGQVLQQRGRLLAVAGALGEPVERLQATATWCWTATSLRDGVHLLVELRGGGLTVRRGTLPSGLMLGVVTLRMQVPGRSA